MKPRILVLLSVVLISWSFTARVIAEDPERSNEVKALTDAGDYAGAEAAARRLLSEAEAEHDADSVEVADALHDLVEILRTAGKAVFPETLEFARRCVAIREKHPDDPVALAYGRNALAIVLAMSGRLQESQSQFEQAVALAKKNLPPGDIQITTFQDNLAQVLGMTGQTDLALRMYDEARAEIEAVLGPDHLSVAVNLLNTANIHADRGNYKTAIELYKRCLKIREKKLNPFHPKVADVSRALAGAYIESGQLQRAAVMLDRARDIYTRAPELPPMEWPHFLTSLGVLQQETGDLRAARKTFIDAYEYQKAIFSPGHRDLAPVLLNLGIIDLNLGNYGSARHYMEQGLQILEETNSLSQPRAITTFLALGAVLQETGDYEDAERYFLKTLERFEEELDPGHPIESIVLNNLGLVKANQGLVDDAIQYYQRSIEAGTRTSGSPTARVAPLVNLGNLYKRDWQHAAAREAYEEALGILQDELGPDHPTVGLLLSNLALSLVGLDELELAEDAIDRAERIIESAYGPEDPRIAVAIGGRVLLLTARDKIDAAVAELLKQVRITRMGVQTVARGLPERGALRYVSAQPPYVDLLVSVGVAAGGKWRRETWNELIQSRALVFDAILERQGTVHESEDPELARLWDDLVSARARMATLSVRAPEDIDDSYSTVLRELREDTERIELDLAQRSERFRLAKQRSSAGLSEVLQALPDDTALVSYARYKAFPSIEVGALGNSQGRPSYAAFVATRGGEEQVAVVPLGDAETIERNIDRWRQHAGQRAGSEGDARKAGLSLKAQIWDPVASHLGEVGRVFIVPDGPLHLVNFAALPAGESAYLIEDGPALHLLTAERDLIFASEGKEAPYSLFAMGGVDYDRASVTIAASDRGAASTDGTVECSSFKKLTFRPLVQTNREIRTIARLWEELDLGDDGGPALYTGSDATEDALKQNSTGHRVLHLATHGFFLGDRCAATSLDNRFALAGDVKTGSRRPKENPLRLSGLAFAGANKRSEVAEDAEDGILTAEEVVSLDLSGVEWVVLSACETGVGDIAVGEGVFDLRRAFLLAGADTVIGSLWSVDDKSTRRWMNALYRARFEQRLSTAEAVRSATLQELRRRRERGESTNAYYWAGFTAVGDWR